MIQDDYRFESAPQEKDTVKKYIGNHKVHQLPFCSHPAAQIQKK